jgi:hypothetical protein
MIRSATDDDKGTAPPKPICKLWVMRNIPATDQDFLEWHEDHPFLSHGLGVREAMMTYVQHLNLMSKELYERQMKEHKTYLHSAESENAEETPEQPKETEPAEMKAPDDTTQIIISSQTIPNSQNILSPQIIPNPQNISSPPGLEQSHPSSQSSLTLPPVEPRADQEQAEQRMGTDINANRLTMIEALELFEILL